MATVFDMFDTDKNNYIDRKELMGVALKLGEVWDDKQLEAALKELDADGDGKVTFVVSGDGETRKRKRGV